MLLNQHFPNFTLFLGGSRSGKSELAESLVLSSKLDPVYLATAQAGDPEMAERIESHRKRRNKNWRTVETRTKLVSQILQISKSEIVLVDCLTLWLSNLMADGCDIACETQYLIAAIHSCKGKVVCVTNEVGMGIVPENALARRFRDAQGALNQSIAAAAEVVIFVAAGLPIALKGSLPEVEK